ncbi:MAG: hypothetical protein PHD05_07425, partial [Sphaerochaetaceae bacterium]|nr:hypothetical protein [Sphaerochaetaceae bacterium]
PLTASTTNWNNVYDLVVASSTSWGNAANLVAASSTYWDQAFAWVNAGHTNWDTAYSWGNHASSSYITSAYATSTFAFLSGANFTGDISVGGFATITSSGIAAFATTTISGDLIVNGSTFVNSQWVTTSTGIYYNLGSVGIGTNSPSSSYAFDLFGDMKIAGHIMPDMTGATGNVSTRKIGDSTHQFSEVWTDELYLGPHSLYVNGVQVISDVSNVMNFTADIDQTLAVRTFGGGNILLESEAMIRASSTNGVELLVPSTGNGNIALINHSVGGDIIFTADGNTNSSNILLTANQKIGSYAPIIELIGNITASGTITATGLTSGSDNTVVILNSSNQLQTTEIDPRIWGTSTFVDGTGSAGYVAYWSDSNTLTAEQYLSASRGGTGISTVTANQLLIGNNTGSGWTQISTSTLGLSTTNVVEGTNLYYTDARSRASISETIQGISYDSGTGTFSLDETYSIPLTASTTDWHNTYFTVASSSSSWDQAYAWVNAGHTNWDTAYSWGDHADEGYLTSTTIAMGNTIGDILFWDGDSWDISSILNANGTTFSVGGLATITASNGNIATAGTLSVTGTSTLAAISGTNLNISGNTTLASLSVTN